MVCTSSIWEVDDLSGCFLHRCDSPVIPSESFHYSELIRHGRYLQTIFPLVACTASVLLLLIQYATRWLSLQAHDTFVHRAPGTNGSSKPGSVTWLGGLGSTPEMRSHIFAPSRQCARIALASLEQVIVLGQIGIYMAAFLQPAQLQSGESSTIVGLVTWAYIFVLNLLRALNFTGNKSSFRLLCLHTSALYTLQWIISLVVARSVVLHSPGKLIGAFELLHCALVTLLVAITASTPAYSTNLASAIPSDALESSQEARASIFGLATFQWVDSVVLKGFKRTLELQDVWGLSEGDESSNIVRGFRDLKQAFFIQVWLIKYANSATGLLVGSHGV
jgi:hypothetical protein